MTTNQLWESLRFPAFIFIRSNNNSKIYTLVLSFTNKFDLLTNLFSIRANPCNPWQKK